MKDQEGFLKALSGVRGRIDFSRRDFIKGAGVIAAGATSMCIVGCAPKDSAESVRANQSASASATEAGMTFSGNAGKTMGEVMGAGWLGNEPDIAQNDIAETVACDIVVCGAGHAGTACARKAAEKGANVIVVEMQTEDMFSVLGNDIGHLNSSWQVDSIGIPAYDPVDFMNEYQICCAGRAQPTLISKFANRSGEAFDWFIDGYTADEVSGLKALNWPVPEGYTYKKGMFHSYVGTCNFESGSVSLQDALLRSQQKAKDAGATFRFATTAVKLVHDDGNTVVTGVVCQNADGSYVEFDAKAVVLACGDIGSNSPMYNAICAENYALGEYADCQSFSGRDGSGIAMAMRMGAKVEIATGGDMGSHASMILSPMEAAETIWLDRAGKRFCNEALGGPLLSGCAGARQPGQVFYSIWDGDWKEVLLNQIAGHLCLKYWDDETIANIATYMNDAETAGSEGSDASGKYLFCADTLDELFDYMGLDAAAKRNALAAIETWNAAAAAGRDDEFGRDPDMLWAIVTPPFYGFAASKHVGGGSLVSTSGLLVTGDQQVQGVGFEPIRGLYATGNTSGGRFPMGYNGIMNGVSIGMCLTLGMCLGEFLATGDLDEATAAGSASAAPKQSDKGMGPGGPM